MIKVYLNNIAIWFDSHAAAADFMRDNPAATFREFKECWDPVSRQWIDKP